MFTGMYYQYFFDFYFKQLMWESRRATVVLIARKDANDEPLVIYNIFTEAEKNKTQVVVYQVLGYEIPQVQIGKYHQEKIFTNMAHHTLIVYDRDP